MTERSEGVFLRRSQRKPRMAAREGKATRMRTRSDDVMTAQSATPETRPVLVTTHDSTMTAQSATPETRSRHYTRQHHDSSVSHT